MIIEFLIYMGGVMAMPDEMGFWKAVFWPYFLGGALVNWMLTEDDFDD